MTHLRPSPQLPPAVRVPETTHYSCSFEPCSALLQVQSCFPKLQWYPLTLGSVNSLSISHVPYVPCWEVTNAALVDSVKQLEM